MGEKFHGIAAETIRNFFRGSYFRAHMLNHAHIFWTFDLARAVQSERESCPAVAESELSQCVKLRHFKAVIPA